MQKSLMAPLNFVPLHWPLPIFFDVPPTFKKTSSLRLYSEEDFQSFVDYPTPEILRVPLDTLILQLVSMGIDVRAFPFLQQPPTGT